MDSGSIYFAKHEGLLVLKFVGHIRYSIGDSYRISSSLDSFVEQFLNDKDVDKVLMDLSETRSIDSTNLGLLAKIAHFCREHAKPKATILSTNEDINVILDTVRFDQVFLIIHDASQPDIELQELPDVDPADKELAHMILDAHKALTIIDDKNREMFKNVVEVLEKRVAGKRPCDNG